jgi:hypothetical protein
VVWRIWEWLCEFCGLLGYRKGKLFILMIVGYEGKVSRSILGRRNSYSAGVLSDTVYSRGFSITNCTVESPDQSPLLSLISTSNSASRSPPGGEEGTRTEMECGNG